MQKTVEINYSEGEGNEKLDLKGTVVLKRLGFGEMNRLKLEASGMRMPKEGAQPVMREAKDMVPDAMELGIHKSVVSCTLSKTSYLTEKNEFITEPYPLTIENIAQLPVEVGDTLFLTYIELNNLDEKKKQG